MDAFDSDATAVRRFACDAMCGGLARWLRALGHDATYTAGIDDRALVEHAAAQGRILLSSDGPLFERRVIASGQVRALRLPRGLKRLDQVEFVVRALGLPVRHPRCMRCNGVLRPVRADEVADRVPARSLTFATEFFECESCGGVFWNGTHWRRIEGQRQRFDSLAKTTRDEAERRGPGAARD